MQHDNRSEGNRIGSTFVYVSLSTRDKCGGGMYRLDVHPDVAVRSGAVWFDCWENFNEYTHKYETEPELFVIEDDDAKGNQFGL